MKARLFYIAALASAAAKTAYANNISDTFKPNLGSCYSSPSYGLGVIALSVAVMAGLAAWRFRRRKKPQRFKIAAAIAVIAFVPCLFIAGDAIKSASEYHFERWDSFPVQCNF